MPYSSHTYCGDCYSGGELFLPTCSWHLEDRLNLMLSRLVGPFAGAILPDGSIEGSPNMVKLLDIKAIRAQQMEDLICRLSVNRLIASAYGSSLDTIGQDWLNISRNYLLTWNDESYRNAIRAKIRVINSDGTYDDMRTLAERIVDGNSYVQVTQLNPNSVRITTDGSIQNESSYSEMMTEAKPDIANMDIIIAVPDAEHPFRFAPSGGYYALTASGGGVTWVDVLKAAFVPAISVGDMASGQIVTTDGASAGDARTITAVGAVDMGLTWRFNTTVAFTGVPGVTTEFNAIPYSPGRGFAAVRSYYELAVTAGTGYTFNVAQASFVPAIIAGNLAGFQVVVTDGSSAGDVRVIDANGAVAAGLDWQFTVTSNFTEATDATSVVNITSGGGALGHVVEGKED